jgi:alpha-1,2-mannosyltransferase
VTAVPSPPGDLAAQPRLRPRRYWWLLPAGALLFAATIAIYVFFIKTHMLSWWLRPVDLSVYREGGASVRHLAPWFSPHTWAPLYHWPRIYWLKFTYPPFAALVFTGFTVAPLPVLARIWVGVNVAAVVATLQVTFGALGLRRVSLRLGAALATAAVVFWIEPVQRTLYLGQIEVVLMLLVLWDLSQPDRRWWKGAGTGLAAGIKLVPLIFIPYLLLTGKVRQAAVAAGTFAVTIAVGFLALPGDAGDWWLHGLFLQGDRTGFTGWAGNQSLRGLLTRLAGSVAAATPLWLVLAVVTGVAGLAAAALLTRCGYPVPGLLTCALTGILVSPISWDHHWVWVVPGVAAAGYYGARAIRRPARWLLAGLAGALVVIFGAWPGWLLGHPRDLGGWSRGLIWLGPSTNPQTFDRRGDQPWYHEYHWHGTQVLFGNLYVFTGIALLALLLIVAAVTAWRRRGHSARPAQATPAAPASRQAAPEASTTVQGEPKIHS